ncbi:hypothetical protein PDESU_02235 [Pontiella desulfatans]|uniref:IrrE N-terminal-like domain-containing protein n=2 Tax=Pontiella desulfatans TaxID=2750659 RepID=A0A6C2U127_PONDE|nr:hypothetical protein PDESU_02235 [Pontiella desulfatans]
MKRILRDLGNPEPPFKIEDALYLLELDRKYYSCADEGFRQEVIHRIKVAGKQLISRPSLLGEVISKADLKALWLPDSKQILIDQNMPPLKHRWAEVHEIAHSVIPWHKQFCLGDPAQTLSSSCRIQIENEANYGGGNLVFLGERFKLEAADYSCNLESVKTLANIYGNTITSTLYRFVEQAHDHLPMFGVVCDHWFDSNIVFNAQNPCEHLIFSESFRNRFSNFDQHQAFDLIRGYCSQRKGGLLGEVEATVLDDNGEAHYFRMESFSNSYKILTLAVYMNPIAPQICL